MPNRILEPLASAEVVGKKGRSGWPITAGGPGAEDASQVEPLGQHIRAWSRRAFDAAAPGRYDRHHSPAVLCAIVNIRSVSWLSFAPSFVPSSLSCAVPMRPCVPSGAAV